jgi:hypothetical protein
MPHAGGSRHNCNAAPYGGCKLRRSPQRQTAGIMALQAHLPPLLVRTGLTRQRDSPEGQQPLTEYCKVRAILATLLPLTAEDWQH